MKRRKWFRVTWSDIDGGVRHDCRRCPIATAIRNAGFKNVVVTQGYVIYGPILDGNAYPLYEAKLPKRVQDFIADFDMHGAGYGAKVVKPFRFSLTLPVGS